MSAEATEAMGPTTQPGGGAGPPARFGEGQETRIVKRAPTQTVGQFGIELRNLGDLWRFAQIYAASGMAPKGMESPEACAIAIQLGMEVGLHPAQAVQSIAVINKRPAIWGDPQLGLVRRSGLLEEFEEWYEHQGARVKRFPTTPDDTTTGVCHVKRVGFPAAEESFSVAMAKKAHLWGKEGSWTDYPFRMLRMRPRGFLLRDQFGDVLKGLSRQAEEYMDVGVVNEEPFLMPQPEEQRETVPVQAQEGRSAEAEEGGTAGGPPPSEAPGEAPAASTGPPAVKIVGAKKSGAGTRKGTPFTRWTVSTSDGKQYDTEDMKVYQSIAKAQLNGLAVRIVAEPGEKNPVILEVVPA